MRFNSTLQPQPLGCLNALCLVSYAGCARALCACCLSWKASTHGTRPQLTFQPSDDYSFQGRFKKAIYTLYNTKIRGKKIENVILIDEIKDLQACPSCCAILAHVVVNESSISSCKHPTAFLDILVIHDLIGLHEPRFRVKPTEPLWR